MKYKFRTIVTAAVAVLASTSAGYAQTKMSASIGFPFKMQSANLPAGNYDVMKISNGSSTVFQLRSTQEHANVFVSARYVIDHRTDSEAQPRLVFRCNSSYCSLAEIWAADGSGYATPRPKLSPAEKEQLAVVPLTATKAD